MKLFSALKQLGESNHPQSAPRAFTLIELLVVIAVLALSASLLLPALATANNRDQTTQCMSNAKQLITGALMYADDFNKLTPPNQPGDIDWCTLGMNWSLTSSDNTNYQKLAQTCLLSPYVGSNYTIFHCPGDRSQVPGLKLGFRVRSISMNSAVGTVATSSGCLTQNGPVNGQWLVGENIGNGCQTVWRTYAKITDFDLPGPSMTWFFADEHCDSINDAVLAVQCANQGITAEFIDRPANYHDGACPFSFADGHVEMHRWIGGVLGQGPVLWQGPNYSQNVNNSADNQDLIWLQQRTSAKK